MRNKAFFAILAFVVLIACNKPSDFGKEIISGSNIPYEQLDTFVLNAVSEVDDSVRTYVPGSVSLTMSNSIVGNVDDPDFGNIQAEAYVNFAIERILNDSLNFIQLDSAVWEVYYDTDSTGQYGDISQPMSLEVFRIQDSVKVQDTLYSTKSFVVDPVSVSGIYNFVPKPLPSDSTHLRFKMNDNFLNFLKTLPDTAFSNSINMRNNFNGLAIKAVGKTKALVRFNFINSNNNLKIYYTKPGGKRDSIKLITNVNCVRHTMYKHDYTGSRYLASITNPGTDSLLFIQSMAGPRVKILLPDLSFLKNDALNFAELEMTVADDNGTAFPKPPQLWLYKKNTSGSIVSITDGTIAINSGYRGAFGGSLEEFSINQKTVFKYKFRLPKHIIDYIKGNEGKELYISVLGASSVPSRVLINGGKNKINPLKLKLIVSKVI
ncbi:MAG: DUF4270 family protein [Saprospiraceae bacterium]|nr:DUF4270 family protein [Saprospiraceae bacterium]